MKSTPAEKRLAVPAAPLTADEQDQQDHAVSQVERARRVLDDEQHAARQRIRDKFEHLGAEAVAELIAASDQSLNKARSALEMGMSAANTHGVASGIVTPHAIRSVRTSATESGRSAALAKRRPSTEERIVREVRAAYADLRTVEPWSEADSIKDEVNRRRHLCRMKPASQDAIRNTIKRIDKKDKKLGQV